MNRPRINRWMTGVAAAIVMTAVTWLFGWWSVPLVALVFGATLHEAGGRAHELGLAAMVAWGALLLVDMASPGFGELTLALSGVMRAPGALLILVTLLFAVGLAWSGAIIGAALGSAFARRRTATA